MTNYELINNNLPIIVRLINNNLIGMDMMKNIEVFETFHSLTGSRWERYEKLGEKFNLSPFTIRNIIQKLNKKVK